MFIFELGERFINLPHLVEAERLAAGKVRVTMVSGNTFDHEGPDAERLLNRLRVLANHPYMDAATSVMRYDQDKDKPAAGSSGVVG